MPYIIICKSREASINKWGIYFGPYLIEPNLNFVLHSISDQGKHSENLGSIFSQKFFSRVVSFFEDV
jgi:hypothetical protein